LKKENDELKEKLSEGEKKIKALEEEVYASHSLRRQERISNSLKFISIIIYIYNEIAFPFGYGASN
jgi:hypothetical protein